MNQVIWACPHCHHENTDLKKETCQPMCGNCEKHFDWEDIWHASDDQTEYLNMVDNLSLRLYDRNATDLTGCSETAIQSLQDDFCNSVKHDIALANIVKITKLENASEYLFKRGYNLNKFFATFSQSTDFGKNDGAFVNGQYLHCISNDIETAKMMIEDYYKSIRITCKEIELVQPVTTTNEDLKRLSTPSEVLGFNDAITIKTERAKKVLQLMDSSEDGPENYMKFVIQVSSETGASIKQIEAELEPFI